MGSGVELYIIMHMDRGSSVTITLNVYTKLNINIQIL